MALSLNPASRGLLLDPANGLADIEAKHIRILHNYSFLEDPSRLIRATRFIARFHWAMEERTQARFDTARENNYIEYILDRNRGKEIEQLAHEDEPLHIMRVLEKEGWQKVLHPRWTVAKADSAVLSQLLKTRQQMAQFGYALDASPAVMYFLTAKLGDRDINELQKLIPRKGLVQNWRSLEDQAKEFAKRLTGKEASTPSRAWQLLSGAPPETILFLEVTSRQQAVTQKIRNFFGKWRQVKQRFPLPEMAELRITPQHPEYPKMVEQMSLLMLDGKLRSTTEIIKFLKPYEPPPPPPPPATKRRAKAEVKPAEVKAAVPEAAKGKGRKKKGEAPPAPPTAPQQPAPPPKAEKAATAKTEAKQGKPPGKKPETPKTSEKPKTPKTAHPKTKPKSAAKTRQK